MNSNLTKTPDKNGNTLKYTYDYQNRLTAMKNQTDSGVISEYKSEYLLNGQKSKEDSDVTDQDGKKSAKTATYTYDLLGRITKETKTGSEDISYTYDSNNNRKEMTVGNKVTAYKYNKNDELLRTDTLNRDTEEDSVVIYKNDKNGNQLATVNRYEIPSDKKDSTYVDIDVTLGDNRLNENVVNHYDALNQLTQTLTKNYKVSFTYDAEGLRASKTVNGEKTVFVWDGDQLVLELSESGKVQKRYVRGNDLVYADKGTGTEKQFYVTDPHGNVVQLTDENGKVVKTYEYDSFGNEVKPGSKDDNPFRYCGEYYDKETGEVYLRARYYQPSVGRFLTRDTYMGEEDDVLSLHLYAYCGYDGVNSVDPSGHCYKIRFNSNIKTIDITQLFPLKIIDQYWNYKCRKHIEKNPKKISSQGIDFIKKAEGFVNYVYDAGDGKRTIGYGHVLEKGENFTSIDDTRASQLLNTDLQRTGIYNKKLRNCLNKTVEIHVRQEEYDALMSLTFNVGPYMWTDDYSPKFIDLLRKGELPPEKVIKQFLSYDHMTDTKTGKSVEDKGLWRRHLNEGLLFTTRKYKYYGFDGLKKRGWEFKG